MMTFLRRIPFHPFLLTAYPILSLLAHNIGQVYPWMAVRSLVVCLLAAMVLVVLLRLVFADWHKAALPVSLLVILLFSYGHLYATIEDSSLLGVNIGRHRYLLAAFFLLEAALLAWLVRRKRKPLGTVTQAINLIALLLIAMPVFQITRYQIAQGSARQSTASEMDSPLLEQGLSTLAMPVGESIPDVYYIILDAYGRQDTLWDYFGYDNTPFVSRLEELGFFVARCSQSNYSVTEFSIASSLNMSYLEDLPAEDSSSSNMAELISHSTVRQAFESIGYRSVAFESGYGLTELRDAGSYFSSNLHPGRANYLGGINAFEALLLRTSIGFLVYERFETLPDHIKTMLNTAYAEHRTRILYTFDELEKVPSDSGPKFVFAHILAPHNPFVFGADGRLVVRSTPFTLNHDPESSDPGEYALGYTNQLTYINQRTLQMVETVLAKSATPPIIILQGDHGPMLRATSADARMTNLIAIYLPPESASKSLLYDSLTPVNIFRLILDGKFHASLGQVEDISYFGSRSASPELFTIIPNDCR